MTYFNSTSNIKKYLIGFTFLLGCFQPAWALLPVQTWKTSTGTRVVFVESHVLPLLDLQLDIDAGERHDPSKQAGLAHLTAHLLDKGVGHGKSSLDEATVADAWADLGAQWNATANLDRTSLRVRTVSDTPTRKAALQLLGNILRAPQFPAHILKREQTSLIAGLREAQTKPEHLGERAFMLALYPHHPYGQSSSETSIQAIQTQDLQLFYQQHYRADRAVLTLVGDLNRAEAEQEAEHLSQQLPQYHLPTQPISPVTNTHAQNILIKHPAQQAHIWMGKTAISRQDPDYFPLLVGNYILGGGGFVSRLTNEIREKRGLAYSVYSYFQALDAAGPFQMGMQTKREQTEQALTLLRQTLADFVAEGPNETELQAAKNNLINGFPLRIDSNRKLLENIAAMAWYNLPSDYLETWTQRIEAVTLEDVRHALQRHLRPEAMITVVVGADSLK
jgi:zinc protease